MMKRATNIARDQLVSLGVCVGKFTHSDKFRLTIGALELLATYAKHKVRRVADPTFYLFFCHLFLFIFCGELWACPVMHTHFSLQPEYSNVS